MKYIVVRTNAPEEHTCSVHEKNCPEIEKKRNLPGFFTKEFEGVHSLSDAWNYIKGNHAWASELCSNCFPGAEYVNSQKKAKNNR